MNLLFNVHNFMTLLLAAVQASLRGESPDMAYYYELRYYVNALWSHGKLDKVRAEQLAKLLERRGRRRKAKKYVNVTALLALKMFQAAQHCGHLQGLASAERLEDVIIDEVVYSTVDDIFEIEELMPHTWRSRKDRQELARQLMDYVTAA